MQREGEGCGGGGEGGGGVGSDNKHEELVTTHPNTEGVF